MCSLCGKSFALLEHHVKTVHGTGATCDKCGKFCPSQESLRVHIKRYHVDQRQIICDLCGESVTNQKAEWHRLVFHTPKDKWPHKCKICSPTKAFLSSGSLQEHMNTHTGEKPFKCKLCSNVAYASHGNLAAHIRSFHKGIKRVKK